MDTTTVAVLRPPSQDDINGGLTSCVEALDATHVRVTPPNATSMPVDAITPHQARRRSTRTKSRSPLTMLDSLAGPFDSPADGSHPTPKMLLKAIAQALPTPNGQSTVGSASSPSSSPAASSGAAAASKNSTTASDYADYAFDLVVPAEADLGTALDASIDRVAATAVSSSPHPTGPPQQLAVVLRGEARAGKSHSAATVMRRWLAAVGPKGRCTIEGVRPDGSTEVLGDRLELSDARQLWQRYQAREQNVAHLVGRLTVAGASAAAGGIVMVEMAPRPLQTQKPLYMEQTKWDVLRGVKEDHEAVDQWITSGGLASIDSLAAAYADTDNRTVRVLLERLQGSTTTYVLAHVHTTWPHCAITLTTLQHASDLCVRTQMVTMAHGGGSPGGPEMAFGGGGGDDDDNDNDNDARNDYDAIEPIARKQQRMDGQLMTSSSAAAAMAVQDGDDIMIDSIGGVAGGGHGGHVDVLVEDIESLESELEVERERRRTEVASYQRQLASKNELLQRAVGLMERFEQQKLDAERALEVREKRLVRAEKRWKKAKQDIDVLTRTLANPEALRRNLESIQRHGVAPPALSAASAYPAVSRENTSALNSNRRKNASRGRTHERTESGRSSVASPSPVGLMGPPPPRQPAASPAAVSKRQRLHELLADSTDSALSLLDDSGAADQVVANMDNSDEYHDHTTLAPTGGRSRKRLSAVTADRRVRSKRSSTDSASGGRDDERGDNEDVDSSLLRKQRTGAALLRDDSRDKTNASAAYDSGKDEMPLTPVSTVRPHRRSVAATAQPPSPIPMPAATQSTITQLVRRGDVVEHVSDDDGGGETSGGKRATPTEPPESSMDDDADAENSMSSNQQQPTKRTGEIPLMQKPVVNRTRLLGRNIRRGNMKLPKLKAHKL